MTIITAAGCEWIVTYRIKKVFFRASVGVMAGDAGIGPWFDLFVGIEKTRIGLIVAICAERGNGLPRHKLVI